MGFYLTLTFAALFSLLAGASCASVGLALQDACEDVRNSSLKLNQRAKIASVQSRNESNDAINFNTSIDWMEAKDMCDPKSLKQKSGPCTEKLLSVLKSYISVLERLSGFESCRFVSQVKLTADELHNHMSKCVGPAVVQQKDDWMPICRWEEPLLCQYTLERLFSFSILAARVFAAGDPARHAEAPLTDSCRA